MALVFPLFTQKMFAALTYKWALTLFAVLALVMAPTPFVRPSPISISIYLPLFPPLAFVIGADRRRKLIRNHGSCGGDIIGVIFLWIQDTCAQYRLPKYLGYRHASATPSLRVFAIKFRIGQGLNVETNPLVIFVACGYALSDMQD